MLLEELLLRLNQGESMTQICDQLGIHRRTISRRLNHLGYLYDKEQKRWKWSRKGEEPLLLQITDDLTTSKVILSNPYIPRVERSGLEEFSQEDREDLRKMLDEWRGRQGLEKGDEKELFQRVKALPAYSSQQKEKKTFVLPFDVIQIVDEFANRERMNKSDLLQIALQDFFAKYGES
ncbi:helix-turn-helix domain-containing protein [Ammoniphilus sp. YIM 78166]|uniref:helix-turn-helix domain-containing protein n=1 Tax=Ammoniphilus sp. YIM 78166 TaxID=1644106 RepID=UPI0010701C6A|nr:helix-turn-helix domain-containing protein [Ammoniphilus sp. YIM 78166]